MARRPSGPPRKSRQKSDALASPVSTAGRAAASALLRLNAAETIEQAYDAWRELRSEHGDFLARCARERRRLAEQGGFLVGAVRAAAKAAPGQGQDGGPPGTSGAPAALLAPSGGDALSGFLREAEEKLTQSAAALEAELAQEAGHFERAFAEIRQAVLHRLTRVSEKVRPRVRLVLRPAGPGRTLLHIERPGQDEAVLLLHALTGRAPTRYDFLFDDSVDDLGLPPPSLYPEEGVDKASVQADAEALGALARREGDFLPVKGHIPVWVTGPDGAAFYRLLQRGPVLEVELQEGQGFRSVLSREEGERLAGHLLRLKLEGKLELDLTAG